MEAGPILANKYSQIFFNIIEILKYSQNILESLLKNISRIFKNFDNIREYLFAKKGPGVFAINPGMGRY